MTAFEKFVRECEDEVKELYPNGLHPTLCRSDALKLLKIVRLQQAALLDLTFTAQKLWDDMQKPIMSGGAITVTHPIIEEAKSTLSTLETMCGEAG